MLMGDNSVIKKSKVAKQRTNISGVEEEANLIYADLKMDDYEDIMKEEEKVKMQDIVKGLEEKGHTIKHIIADASGITGIKVDENVTITAGETSKIEVEFLGNTEGFIYYILIDGAYHKMILREDGVKIEEEPSNVGEDGEEVKLEAVADNTNVTIESVVGNIITLKAAEEAGSSIITVTYGSHTATCKVKIVKRPTENSEADNTIEFTNDSGKIDIIWLDTNNNIINNPNAPVLTAGNESMTPQIWSEEEQKFVDADVNSNWYNYTEGEGDHKTSKWANAKTANESYFVWIPRYAYRITYYKSGTEEPVGYYDGYGLWMADTGKVKYKIDEGVETVKGKDGELYIVHPAFMKDTGKTAKDGTVLPDYDRGGWSENLAGFWIAKYEMSGIGATLKSTFGVQSQGSQKIGEQYTSARQATYGYSGQEGADGNTSFMNSHMIKNSEWGAVAYLTHSVYGRNRNEITKNGNSSYYTGGGTGTAYIANTAQSTTGNTYGVYDMSGGANERAAAYNNTGSNVTAYGWTGLTSRTPSSRYATRYYNETGTATGTAIYQVGKIGDATKETYLGTGNYSWYNDHAGFAYDSLPFFQRGGNFSYGTTTGVFHSNVTLGDSSSNSFRVVLCARFIIIYLQRVLKEIFKQLILCELIKQNNCKKIVLIFLKIKYKINNKE